MRVKGSKKEGGLELNLSGVDMNKFSNQILKLKKVEALDVSNNHVTHVPPQICKLSRLEELRMASNDIHVLPNDLLKLQSLTLLDINDNKVKALPFPVSRWANLTNLNIAGNFIRELPQDLDKLTKLTELRYMFNTLQSIPFQVMELTSLTLLDLEGNDLETLPDGLARLTNLTHLSVRANQLTSVPPFMGALSKLQTLILSNNAIVDIGKEIGKLTSLTHLTLEGNRIESLDDANIHHLVNLNELILNQNFLDHLPSGIGFLQSLHTLEVEQNKLTVLTAEVGWLAKTLRKLSVHVNELERLPGDLCYLNVSCQLNVKGNPLSYPFSSWVQRNNCPPIFAESLRVYLHAHPSFTVASGPGLKGSLCGLGTQFIVEAFDSKGAPRVNGKDDILARIVYPDKKKPKEEEEPEPASGSSSAAAATAAAIAKAKGRRGQLPPLDDPTVLTDIVVVKDVGDGTYSCFYNPRVTGHAKLYVYVGKWVIKDAPFDIYIAPGETFPGKSSIEGLDERKWEAGKPVQFSIVARDYFGNQQDRGGNIFHVQVQGGSRPVPNIADLGDGSYSVSFLPGWGGTYIVDVSLDGTPLPCSPVHVMVAGDPALGGGGGMPNQFELAGADAGLAHPGLQFGGGAGVLGGGSGGGSMYGGGNMLYPPGQQPGTDYGAGYGSQGGAFGQPQYGGMQGSAYGQSQQGGINHGTIIPGGPVLDQNFQYLGYN